MASPPGSRYQQTGFQERIAQARAALESWAANPWRRLSLLLIVLLISFSIGGAVGSITGTLAKLDPVGALICVRRHRAGHSRQGPADTSWWRCTRAAIARYGPDRLALRLAA